MEIQIGDMITLKKPHPCKSYHFKVLRVGADIGIKCQGCGHYMLLPRNKLMKSIKTVHCSAKQDLQEHAEE